MWSEKKIFKYNVDKNTTLALICEIYFSLVFFGVSWENPTLA